MHHLLGNPGEIEGQSPLFHIDYRRHKQHTNQEISLWLLNIKVNFGKSRKLIGLFVTWIKLTRIVIFCLDLSHIRESGTREIFSCKIRNSGLWNPEYSSRNLESHRRLKSRIQVPVTRNVESSARNPEYRTWNAESKTSFLDSLTWGELRFLIPQLVVRVFSRKNKKGCVFNCAF